jgi:copper homeostasis protein
MQIEIIATNQEDATIAEKCGATRIELIHAFAWGGLSPKLEVTKAVCSAVSIPVNIMLRPCSNSHGNNHRNSFCYNAQDIKTILAELKYIRDNTSANGIVFGALDKNNNLDIELLECIIKHKGHLKLTFHRAIDVCNDIISTYQQLLTYNEIDLVLTSGGKTTALDGIATIKQMIQMNLGHQNAQIMAGSGITPDNVTQIIEYAMVQHIHLGTGVRNVSDNTISKEKLQQLHQILKLF